MKAIVALALTFSIAAVAGCLTTSSQYQPSVDLVSDPDFAYLLVHANIEAESPLPHLLPRGSRSSYRILGITQQGNCVKGCPASTIYVAVWNYIDHADGRIRVFRIDGLQFYSFAGVESYRPTVTTDTFLTFQVRSNLEPRRWELYEVNVSQDTCTIKKVASSPENDSGHSRLPMLNPDAAIP